MKLNILLRASNMKKFIPSPLYPILFSMLVTGQASAFGLGDLVQEVAGRVAVETATKAAVSKITESDNGDVIQQQVSLADAAPIAESPLAVNLITTQGGSDAFALRPKIALAGYNVGAYLTDKVTSRTFAGDGAKVSMALQLEGVDTAMLERIANAGHADLVAQLQAIGVDVIDAPTLFQSPTSDDISHSKEAVEGGQSPKTLLLVGPKNVGAVLTPYSIIRKGFNGNVGVKSSSKLDAIVLYPNVALDFAWTSGSGSSMFNKKVSVEGGMRFALDQTTKCVAIYSNDGRFVDKSVQLGLKEDIGVDDPYGTLEKASERDNSGAVGLSHALGLGLGSNSGESYFVVADKQRYELLAMNAVKGFNKALVAQIKSAKGI